MQHAIISSKDLWGPENPGRVMSANFGIMLATFLNPKMDVNARIEHLHHYILGHRPWTNAMSKKMYNEVFEQPNVTTAVKKLCKHFGLKCTPRIEKNLREAVLKLSLVRKEELRREIVVMQERLDRIMRLEK
jgi:hypothetical protein